MNKYINGKLVKLNSEQEKEIKSRQEIDKDLIPSLPEYVYKRLSEYPDIGDQLDATLKQFTMMRLNGVDMNADMDVILGQWLAVKKKYPKPEDSSNGEEK